MPCVGLDRTLLGRALLHLARGRDDHRYELCHDSTFRRDLVLMNPSDDLLGGFLLPRQASLAAQYGSCHVIKWLEILLPPQSFTINLHAMLRESLAEVVSALVQFEAGNRDAG